MAFVTNQRNNKIDNSLIIVSKHEEVFRLQLTFIFLVINLLFS